jgi:hypothetical protein
MDDYDVSPISIYFILQINVFRHANNNTTCKILFVLYIPTQITDYSSENSLLLCQFMNQERRESICQGTYQYSQVK